MHADSQARTECDYTDTEQVLLVPLLTCNTGCRTSKQAGRVGQPASAVGRGMSLRMHPLLSLDVGFSLILCHGCRAPLLMGKQGPPPPVRGSRSQTISICSHTDRAPESMRLRHLLFGLLAKRNSSTTSEVPHFTCCRMSITSRPFLKIVLVSEIMLLLFFRRLRCPTKSESPSSGSGHIYLSSSRAEYASRYTKSGIIHIK